MSTIEKHKAVSFYLEYHVKREANEKTAHRSSTMNIAHAVVAVQTLDGTQYKFNKRVPNQRKIKNDPRRLIADAFLQIEAMVGGGYCDERCVNWGLDNMLPRLLGEDPAFKKGCELILQHYGDSATVGDLIIYEGLPYQAFSHIPCSFKAHLKDVSFVELEEASKTITT